MRPIIWAGLAAGLVTAGLADPSVGRGEEKVWKNHNSLKSEDALTDDWTYKGKLRIQATGVTLQGNTRMVSRFEVADGALIVIGFQSRNRNFYVDLCGESVEFRESGEKGGIETHVVFVQRKGRKLTYGRWVNGRPGQANVILLPQEAAGKLSRVAFHSRPAHIPNAPGNAFRDVELKMLNITGKVQVSPGS